MGMFDKLFKKEEEITEVAIMAPITGELTDLEEVPDPVFAQKMMGEGIAIKPDEGKVFSPIDGEIVQVFETNHAIGLRAKNGAEILIHIGLETVNLHGEGFIPRISAGDQVKVGELLMEFDLDIIAEKASSTVTPIIITNSDDMNFVEKSDGKSVRAEADRIMTVRK